MHADFSTTVITYGWCNPTKANKTVLTNFYPCVRTHRPAPFPSLSHTVTLGGPPAPSLKRDVAPNLFLQLWSQVTMSPPNESKLTDMIWVTGRQLLQHRIICSVKTRRANNKGQHVGPSCRAVVRLGLYCWCHFLSCCVTLCVCVYLHSYTCDDIVRENHQSNEVIFNLWGHLHDLANLTS